MKKNILFLATALGLFAAGANGATYYVDFGNNNLTSNGKYLMENATNANTTNPATKLDALQIGNSGLVFSCSQVLNGTGNGGTFVGGGGSNGIGVGEIPSNSGLLNKYKDNSALNLGWQDLASSGNSQTNVLTFSGLQANTTYTFTFLSVRANDGLTGTGTWGMSFSDESNVTGKDFSMLGYSGNDSTGSNIFSLATVNAAKGQGAELTYKFTTGEIAPDSVMLNLTGKWNLNMATIDVIQVPEPATASLSLLGLALFAVRRRRA